MVRMLILMAAVTLVGLVVSESAVAQSAVYGVVVNEKGEPLEGVEFWVHHYRTKDGGYVSYTGHNETKLTGATGRFSCPYGGEGRTESAAQVTFLHPDYAPTWTGITQSGECPLTVTLDRGVQITGNISDKAIQVLRDGKANGLTEVILYCGEGDWPARLVSTLGADGTFSFRIPSEPARAHYTLRIGATDLPFRLEANKPVPNINVVHKARFPFRKPTSVQLQLNAPERGEELAPAK